MEYLSLPNGDTVLTEVNIIGMNTKELIENTKNFKFIDGDTDLYICFYEMGINMLNETGKRLALLTQNDETFLVDLNTKKIVTSFNTKKVQDNGNSSFLIGIVNNERTGKASYIVYNVISGKSIVTSENEAVTINPNYVIVFNDEIETYYNTKLERIYSNRKK